MKFSDCYEGNFIEAADLMGKRDVVTLTIKSVAAPNTVKSEDGRLIAKPVIYFEETERGLICNVTNARRITLTSGRGMDDWAGLKVPLCLEDDKRPDWGGKRGPCVRVKLGAIQVKSSKPIDPTQR